jgi:hypothetical protein
MEDATYTTMSPMSDVCPRSNCRTPNQKVSPKVPYIAIMDGAITRPIQGATLVPCFLAWSKSTLCCFASFACAPNAATIRIEENISYDTAEAILCGLRFSHQRWEYDSISDEDERERDAGNQSKERPFDESNDVKADCEGKRLEEQRELLRDT